MKEQNSTREKWNFKPYIIVAAVIALIFAIVGVMYFAESYRYVHKFTYENGEYYDKKNDITYVSAPMCYTYVAKSKEEYATSDKDDLYYVCYTEGEGENKKTHAANPEELLTTNVSRGGVIYYNPEKFTLPQTKDFKWDVMYLCENSAGVVHATQELDSTVTDSLLDGYFAAPDDENLFDSQLRFELTHLKQIRVSSKSYKALFMVMELYTDGKGSYYISSVYDERLVKTDSAVFSQFFEEKGTGTLK